MNNENKMVENKLGDIVIGRYELKKEADFLSDALSVWLICGAILGALGLRHWKKRREFKKMQEKMSATMPKVEV